MSDIDQQIQVTISKIFNWPTSYLNSELSIQFRTLLNQTAIFSKKITPLRRSNILRLNCSLKITFNPAQNHLIASLLSASRQQLMTFLIDLQVVKERKVMFIKEQNGQCMLQVDCRSLQKQENGQKIEIPIETKSTLDNFISQKQKLITVMSEKSFKSSNPKDTFAQGLYSLLLQTRQVRNNGVVKQQQINGISTKKAEQFRYQSLKDYMIGEHKLSVKDLKMLPTPRNSLRINRSLDSKFSPYKQL